MPIFVPSLSKPRRRDGFASVSSDTLDVTKIDGEPAAVKISLICKTTGSVIAKVASNDAGEFSIDGLSEDFLYTLLIEDPAEEFNGTAALNNVRPVLP